MRPRHALLLAAAACLVLYAGWRPTWFLCDDAFIAFRYVSNSVLGRGYVWNPAPFRPVEGYTSFLWVVLLDGVWRLTGVEPPRAANVLSLAFSCASLVVTALIGTRLELRGPLRSHRLLGLALVLAAVVTHRTFVIWSSSGLETALFNALLLAWLYVLLFGDGAPRAWVFGTTSLAALAALARPDGIIAVAVTAACLARAAQRRVLAPGALLAAFPLLAIPLHLVWRRVTYEAWVPNTYYAKATGAWPASGARYLLSFVIEYGVLVWLVLALLWVVRAVRRAGALADASAIRRERIAGAIAAFGVPFAYYTFVIGGDHFEYRIYSGLVPLLALTTLVFADRLFRRAGPALGVLALSAGVALPIPWVHAHAARRFTTRETTRKLLVPVAPRFPWPLRPYVEVFDDLQAWLIPHFVGVRHQEHKVFARHLLAALPTRERGAQISWDGRPVLAVNSVGVLGWVFPNVAVIDTFGLNDRVVARNPIAESAVREMAHERRPPDGYAECFKPNLDMARGRVTSRSLTDQEIRACEDLWWARAAR